MNKEIQTSQNTLKAIKSRKYANCYLIYNRKSTDEADSQKNSIDYQKTENTRHANNTELSIAQVTIEGFCTDGIISERHSGFKEGDELFFSKDGMVQYRIDRPKFQQMIQYVNAGYFKGIICLCWDRISRNKGDDTIIRKLMRRDVDIRFVYASYDRSSAGELHMDIDGMFAQHHSRVTSEKVRLSTLNNRRKGICTYRAPIGYLNEGKMDRKPFDPVRAPIIKEMFELYATGDWSLSDIARHANNQGFTTVPMRRRRTKKEMLAEEHDETAIEKISRPVTENHISRILTNKFYTGRILGPDGKYIESISHEALVDDDTFNLVQHLLGKKTTSIHYAEKIDYPLRGIVRCSYCHRVYTPYMKKGILYFNARCTKDCQNTMKNCNLDFISEKFLEAISNLYFTDIELEQLEARTSTEISLLEEKRLKEFEKIERQKKHIREDLAYLRSNRLQLLKSGVYTLEGMAEEQSQLEAKLDELLEDEEISEAAMVEVMKDVVTLSELLKNAIPIYKLSIPHEKDRLIRLVFSELFISQNTSEYKVKKGFEAFENRFSAICDPIAWLSELYRYRAYIRDKIYELEKLTTPKNTSG